MIYLFAISFVILVVSAICLTSYGVVFLLNYLGISFKLILSIAIGSLIIVFLSAFIETIRRDSKMFNGFLK